MRKLLFWMVAGAFALTAAGYAWLQHPMVLATASVDLAIEPGTSPLDVGVDVDNSEVDVSLQLLYA